MSSKIINIDLPEFTQCSLLEMFIRPLLSPESYEIYVEALTNRGMNIENLKNAAGESLLNEAIITVVKLGMENDRDKQLSFDFGENNE